MRLLVTILILMTSCFAFDAGKILLASNYVVSVLLAFQTWQWIHNVRINLQTKEVGSRKDRESKHEYDRTGIYLAAITLNCYLPHLHYARC